MTEEKRLTKMVQCTSEMKGMQDEQSWQGRFFSLTVFLPAR